MIRNFGSLGLRNWALAIAKNQPRRAKVDLACGLAVILYAMWRASSPFRDRIGGADAS